MAKRRRVFTKQQNPEVDQPAGYARPTAYLRLLAHPGTRIINTDGDIQISGTILDDHRPERVISAAVIRVHYRHHNPGTMRIGKDGNGWKVVGQTAKPGSHSRRTGPGKPHYAVV